MEIATNLNDNSRDALPPTIHQDHNGDYTGALGYFVWNIAV